MGPQTTVSVPLNFQGRAFGVREEPRLKFVTEDEGCFPGLIHQLCEESVLLGLAKSGPSGLTSGVVWEAYGHDLKLLQRYRSEFEECMRAAVRCSVAVKDKTKTEEKAERTYSMLVGRIPALGKVPLLELSHIRAAKPPATQLYELCEEFRAGVQRLLNLFGYWLQMLVEAELFGLADWSATDVCRYHYFRHEITETTLAKKTTVTKVQASEDRVWNKITELTMQQVSQVLFQERHIHTIVAAQTWDFQNYPRQVPGRVAEFLSAVPVWLRPHIKIADGQMTMEEVVRMDVDRQVVELTTLADRYEYEPGVLLGNYAATGWNLVDMKTDTPAHYDGQICDQERLLKQARVKEKKKRFSMLVQPLIASAILALVLLLGWNIYRWWQVQGAITAAAYQKYVQVHQSEARYERPLNTVFPVGDRPLLKISIRGNELSPQSFVLAQLDGVKLKRPIGYVGGAAPVDSLFEDAPVWEDMVVPKQGPNGYYGDVDLGPQFGLYYWVHVLSLDREKIVYTLEKYGESRWNN